MSKKIADQEHRGRAAEAALKQKDAPMTSGMRDGMSYLSPHRAPGSSYGPTRNALEAPSIPIGGMIPITQLKESILGAINGHEYRESNSYTYLEPYTSSIDQLKMPKGYRPSKFQHFDGTGKTK
ncbi:hypothetical protein LIER_41330 [Lithospermum erythrorhizon]|uniref:Uncharacterized protein n=1 Tax=Lithospermum erythrorhizon TaxID=34254 RepID=A0AAV3RBC5_LITER